MPKITAVRVESTGTHPSHITYVKLDTGVVEARSTAVNNIDSGSYYYYTTGGGQTASVGTVHPPLGTAYIRTKADTTTKDNLLSLPRF